ncbi:SAM-dependent methyltransferase [Streptomyces sp. NPDC001260]|uniref:SAM-dependent methyltransferase n=1 Tax=Streptomyces sp. NPDC001260 TaxID=3364551 RepID=UPI0036860AE6
MTEEAAGEWHGWRAATEAALYGPEGFYRRPEGPAGHFRTSVHASPLFAGAVARLLCRVDETLGRPARLDFVDMAAGRGELAAGVLAALPPEVAARTRVYAVEVADRPADLDERVHWLPEPPHGVTGLLFANEWLDNVPLDIAEVDADGVPRRVLVRRDGTERLGERVDGAEAEWLARWWPLSGGAGTPGGGEAGPSRGEEGLRAEIGLPRDEAWAGAVAAVDRGLAVAVDYAHTVGSRPLFGTLTGFRAGRETAPVPDGSCDITAHVALDACAAHGEATVGARTARDTEGGAAHTARDTEDGEARAAHSAAHTVPRALLLRQRDALRALGITGARPPLTLASTQPAAYVRALASAGEAAELTAPGGLGDFGWLLQPVGIPAAPID